MCVHVYTVHFNCVYSVHLNMCVNCALKKIDLIFFPKKSVSHILVEWNGIKMRCSNTVFYVYLRKSSRNKYQISSTALELDTSYVNITQYLLGIKTVLLNLIFMRFHETKNLGLAIFQPCLLYTWEFVYTVDLKMNVP